MTDRLQKVVAVTGASSGIGEATARHLAELGYKVMLAARRTPRLETIAAEINKTGQHAIAIQVDVTRRTDLELLVKSAIDIYGRLDALVNNAGYGPIAPLDALAVDDWDRMVDVNFKGVLNGVAAALPVFKAQGSGHFINIASVAGIKVAPLGSVYSATKFAVRAFSEGLRQELPEYIRTTLISPGNVTTEISHSTTHQESIQLMSQLTEGAMSPISIARMIAYALEQPKDICVDEIVLRPTVQKF